MGVVEFLRPYTEKDARELLRDTKTREGARGSLVSYFARKMVGAASDELRSITRQTTTDTDSISLTPELGKVVLERGQMEVGAVFLGLGIISIEEAIWDHQFDPAAFKNRLGESFRGTPFVVKEDGHSAGGIVPIPVGKFKEMVQAANADKTLTVFFRKPILLPERMRNVLFGSHLEYILPILPAYERAAKLLVA